MKKRTLTRGFTLIELIVSVGLFAIVSMITATAYLNLIDLGRRTRNTNDLADNLSFAVTSMATEIRTGTVYRCSFTGGDSNAGTLCSRFYFHNSDGCTVIYELVNQRLRVTQNASGACTAVINPSYMTDPKIKINNLDFYVKGSSSGDTVQPFVVITVQGEMPVAAGNTQSFLLQTTATERGVDL